MQNGSEYADPRWISGWNKSDYVIWFNENQGVLNKLEELGLLKSAYECNTALEKFYRDNL